MNNYRIQSSGLHDFAVFSPVLVHEIDIDEAQACVDTQYNQDALLEELRSEDLHVVYKIEVLAEPNFELIKRLKMICFKIPGCFTSEDEYYLVANGDDSYYCLEAYQALAHGTADIDAFLLKNGATFVKYMGKELYDECIASITETEVEIAWK